MSLGYKVPPLREAFGTRSSIFADVIKIPNFRLTVWY
jgi:hypothetical protein